MHINPITHAAQRYGGESPSDAAYDAAEERVLADAEEFGDWFHNALCEMEDQPDSLPRQIREERTPEDFTDTPVAHLYRLAIDFGQRSHVRLAALDAIKGRYLKFKEHTISELAASAEEARRDREEGEWQDHWDAIRKGEEPAPWDRLGEDE